MPKECKHQWRLLDKMIVTLGNGKFNMYIFFCSKCLKFRKVSNEKEAI